jgi:protein ImuB
MVIGGAGGRDAAADRGGRRGSGGREAAIVAWAGPWPCEERWWDPGGHRRRARIQVVTAGDVAHLLVVESGRWAVEATYD